MIWLTVGGTKVSISIFQRRKEQKRKRRNSQYCQKLVIDVVGLNFHALSISLLKVLLLEKITILRTQTTVTKLQIKYEPKHL